MGIKLNTYIFNLIRQIQKSRIFQANDMRNPDTVASYLRTIKEDEVAEWIETHKVEYLTGLLQGFEVDNSQAAQLKDIHTEPASEIDKLKIAYSEKSL